MYAILNKMKRIFLFLSCFFISLPVYSQLSGQIKEQAVDYRDQGYELQKMGDFRGALGFYKKAVYLDPYYFQAYNDAGVVLEALGEDLSAIEMYEKAISLNPGYGPPYTNLALLYKKRGENAKAGRYLMQRVLSGKDKGAWWYKARETLIDLDVPVEIKKQLLSDEIGALSRQVSSQYEQERLRKIEESRLHFNIGSDLFSKGDYEEAAREFRSALSLNPDDKTLQMEVGYYLAKAKKERIRQEIKVHIESALSEVEGESYDVAADELKRALSVIFGIQE